ncbi:unnamed protein product [Mytilus coruscus]|uniref:Uncharacterized protein n=1 Tax=Mytilus coruscus TaxID=42192 RepID=A0A6J8E8V5_MYTCO|nr:unnamed protein product [Mytilus coruscus]
MIHEQSKQINLNEAKLTKQQLQIRDLKGQKQENKTLKAEIKEKQHGTGRDGKKIQDMGIHTKKSTLSFGYKVIAKEDSETVANVIKDTLQESASYQNNNSEPAAIRLIRTASEILGPRGDEKNGVRQQWLAFMHDKKKSSKIINYGGNRFNNLFTSAVSIVYHQHDVIDVLSNYFETPNLQFQSVLADISCEGVMSQVAAIAMASVLIAEPYWNLINSNEKYVDLYKFVRPLQSKLAE